MNALLTGTALGHRTLRERLPTHATNLRTSKLEAAAIAHWPSCAEIVVDLSPCNGAPARRANLQVSIGILKYGKTLWAARFWEQDAPWGVKPVDWLLFSQWRLSCVKDTLDLLHRRPDLVTGLGYR